MNFYYKPKGGNDAVAWVEDFCDKKMDYIVVAEAKLIIAGNDRCLIDTIDTDPNHRRKGYASEIVEHLASIFTEVAPIGIVPTAQAFWDKHGMEDALGDEE
tara:strand:- start:7454 stop:7756 length:303 start_codon:yes stop_codon:yes gene_type:complete